MRVKNGARSARTHARKIDCPLVAVRLIKWGLPQSPLSSLVGFVVLNRLDQIGTLGFL